MNRALSGHTPEVHGERLVVPVWPSGNGWCKTKWPTFFSLQTSKPQTSSRFPLEVATVTLDGFHRIGSVQASLGLISHTIFPQRDLSLSGGVRATVERFEVDNLECSQFCISNCVCVCLFGKSIVVQSSQMRLFS